MDKLGKKAKKRAGEVCSEIWKISNELDGLGSLFLYQSRDVCLEDREFAGIGSLIQSISKQLEELEGALRKELG